MKIGIFGGTFDPPHIGHLIVADDARAALGLDEVLFIPAARSPHKLERKTASATHRLKLIRLAIAGNPAFRVSDIEIQRGRISYTVNTLERLHASRPHDELFLLIGMDNVKKFDTWKAPERIIELVTIVVMTRPGVQQARMPKRIAHKTLMCAVPEIGISSTDIRHRVQHGRPFRHLVPDKVYEYILKNKLYRTMP